MAPTGKPKGAIRWRPLVSRLPADLAAAAVLALYLVHALGRASHGEIWDDAWFFHRIAHIWLKTGLPSWNPGEPPVHGNTSQLFQIVVTALGAITRDYSVALTKVFLTACLGGWYWLVSLRSPWLALAGLMSPLILLTGGTGMETALAIFLVGLFLHVSEIDVRGWSSGFLAVLLYWVRPDSVLIAAGLLAFQASERKSAATRAGIASALGIGASLLLFRHLYGTAFPLSFHLKSLALSTYDSAYLQLGMRDKLHNVLMVAVCSAPFLAVCSRAWRRELPLLVSAALFFAYHLVFTHEIMGYHARFYAPGFAVLVFAAARAATQKGGVLLEMRVSRVLWAGTALVLMTALSVQRQWIEGPRGFELSRMPLTTYLASLPAFLGPAAPFASALAVGSLAAVGAIPLSLGFMSNREIAEAQVKHYRATPKVLEVEKCFGPTVSLAHSELGVLGIHFPDAHITDFSGLMNPDLALG
ncbi:MAG TPA: hypothetical protein VL588_11530, partial [Bdellovibrionota bacterium]|nr:hypothetical protein [Bdellovibrionota bacterium]